MAIQTSNGFFKSAIFLLEEMLSVILVEKLFSSLVFRLVLDWQGYSATAFCRRGSQAHANPSSLAFMTCMVDGRAAILCFSRESRDTRTGQPM